MLANIVTATTIVIVICRDLKNCYIAATITCSYRPQWHQIWLMDGLETLFLDLNQSQCNNVTIVPRQSPFIFINGDDPNLW